MGDENPAPEQPDESTDVSPEPQSSEPIKPPVAAQPDTGNELQAVKKELSGYERSTLRWTIVIVAVNALTCLFIGLQFYEMRSGGSDTHALAVAAKTQADKMTNVSDAAEKIQKAADNLVVQDQRIADNARLALDASAKQNRAALDAAISATRLEERAWVGVESRRLSKGKYRCR